MTFVDTVVDFLKSYWMTILLSVLVLAAVGFVYSKDIMSLITVPQKGKAIPDGRDVQVSQKGAKHGDVHLAVVSEDDFNYLDLSKSVVVPVTDPTNDVQSFTKYVDERGMTIWEPNVMMDPTDILSDEDYERAVDAARPTMWEGQLKRMTTPSILQKDASVFYGTPWPEGGPGTDRYCITRDDIVHKGIYSDDTTHGTWGAGSC